MKKLEYMTEPELRYLMNSLAHRVEDGCLAHGVEKPLFALLIFNDPKIGQYISNCRREDMIKALRETADRIERNEDVPRQ
jgi:hypothetical protein